MSFESFRNAVMQEHAALVPLMHEHGVSAVHINPKIAMDSRPNMANLGKALKARYKNPEDVLNRLFPEFAQDNTPSQMFSPRGQMQYGQGDSFSDRYGADYETPEARAFNPAASKDFNEHHDVGGRFTRPPHSKDQERGDFGQGHFQEGVDAETGGQEALYNHGR
jgi:hypothetical protein